MQDCCLRRKSPPPEPRPAPHSEAPPWLGTGLQPYPPPFVVPPGGRLSALAHEEGVRGLECAGVGAELVLLARGDAPGEPLRAFWVPLCVVEYGACALCVGEAPRAAFHGAVVFDPTDPRDLRDPQVFCAPPLGGYDVGLLARMVLREEQLPQLTLSALHSLGAVAAWTPARAAAEVAPLLARLEGEIDEWKAGFVETAVAPPRADWGVYGAPGADGQGEGPDSRDARAAAAFTAALQQRIQAYARRNRVFPHRKLPSPAVGLYQACREIMTLSAAHGDHGIARRLHTILTGHPRTLVLAAKDTSLAAPGWGESPAQAVQLLGSLHREEAAEVGGKPPLFGEYPPGAAPYVFRLDEAVGLVGRMGYPRTLHAPQLARGHLNLFLGGYLDGLNLAAPVPSYVTGSAAMSSVLRPANWDIFPDHGLFLASYYPVQCTEALAPGALASYLAPLSGRRRDGSYGFPAPEGLLRPGDPGALRSLVGGEVSLMAWTPPRLRPDQAPDDLAIAYTVCPGADVDIAVEAEGDEDVFDTVARAHFMAIQGRFPAAQLVRVEKEGGHHMWRVECPADQTFRVVEIYQAGWPQICTHHVAPVRLAYTALASGEYGFLLTATCVLAAAMRTTPDYYYFASRKTVPQEIILKYARRGYPPLPLPAAALGGKDVHTFPGALSWAILAWAGRVDGRWQGRGPLDPPSAGRRYPSRDWEEVRMGLPALSAYGPYNLAALPTEAYLALAFDLVLPWWRPMGAPPRLRSARLYDAWDSPLEATDAPTVAHRLAELGLATGDLIHLDPRALGCPQWLLPYSVAMVLCLETEDEKRLSTGLVAEGEPAAAPPAGARYYHPPSEGAPGFLAGGEFWAYPLRSSSLAEHLRGRVLYGPLYDPAFRATAETWGLVAPGWGGPDEAAQRAYRARGLWGNA